jgi:signal transduction histidine kinase
MTRPRHVIAVFAVALAVAFGAVGWLTVEVLRLDRAAAEAQRQAALEENVRLAMWRLESAVAPLIARESARPYFEYAAFYPAERAYTRMYRALAFGEVLVPSPLLVFSSPFIRLHFECDARGTFRSPQVPTGNMRDLAAPRFVSVEQLDIAATRLAELRRTVQPDQLLAALPLGPPAGVTALHRGAALELTPPASPSPQQAEEPGVQSAVAQQQLRMSQQESAARQRALDNLNAMPMTEWRELPWEAEVTLGPLQPLWQGDELLLARRVVMDDTDCVQGVWLDWPALRRHLHAEIADLFPAAQLMPRRGASPSDQRVMAALPVVLQAGSPARIVAGTETPTVWILAIAWGALVLAGLAVAALLAGSLALSERRAAFVSAVTHELRTPLTTFQLYTDMLSQGVVQDDAKRHEYLATLNREAGRLARLIDNVLSFARLERNRAPVQIEAIAVSALLDRVRVRLAERAALGGFEFVVEAPPAETAERLVPADAGAVEQILFNLVDNACKYAAGADRAEIVLSVAVAGRRLRIRVRDFGPGVAPDVRPRLFRPFHKSAEAAAHSAPGVGLGLALSRRLARRMHGELRAEMPNDGGAAFALELPLVARGPGGRR